MTNSVNYVDPPQTKKEGLFRDMYSRCCTPKMKADKPWYDGTTICDEWLKDHKKFYKWVGDNYYVLPSGEQVQLEKDIKFPGNKEYAPDKCMFIPRLLNLFCREYQRKKNGLPTGVYANKSKTKFRAVLTTGQRKYKSDWFDNSEDALNEYWDYKRVCFEEYLYPMYTGYVPEELLEYVRNWVEETHKAKLIELRGRC